MVAAVTFNSLVVGVTAGAALPTSATAANVATVAKAGFTETIHTTANHPWLTADRGWVVAGGLRNGEAVVTLDGQRGVVLTTQAVAGHDAMDNLTVADDHTYAVGNGQWVVHNIDIPPPEDLIHLKDLRFTQQFIAEHFKYGYDFFDAIDRMRAGTMSPWDYEEPIRVFKYDAGSAFWQRMGDAAKTKRGFSGSAGNLEDGQWYSLDNQRLGVAKASLPEDYEIPVRYATDNEIEGEVFKFSTTNGGVSAIGEQTGLVYPPGPPATGC